LLDPSFHLLDRRTCLILLAAFIVGTGACGSKSPTAPTSPSTPPSTNVSLTSISPTQGSTTGGNNVTLNGANFASDAKVLVGGIVATNVVLQGSTALTAVVGANPATGPADVVVTSGGHSATLSRAFTFVAPSGNNQPPVVTNISVGSRPNKPAGFADVNETVTLIADATDAETPVSALTFLWTGPGTFGGTTATTSWHLPATVSPTPSPVTVSLTAVETYVEGKVTHTQTSQPKTFVMQVHDSQKEILDMGTDFLTLFSQSNIPTSQVLHNFSTSCAGRDAEAGDTNNNRATYAEDFSKFRITAHTPVVIQFGGRCQFNEPGDACSAFDVHWEATYIKAVTTGAITHKVGDHETTDGTDYVTAVLENNQWRLCSSRFSGTATNPLTGAKRLVEW
jgi:hypothetical protein